MNFFSIIRYNLANLATFNGRDTRATFWPYAAFLFVISMIINAFAMVSEMSRVSERMHKFAIENPDVATIHQSASSYSIQIHGSHPELMPDMANFLQSTVIITVALLALFAAALVRRLHDRGKSGAWGLLPLPFLAFGFSMMPKIFEQSPPDMSLFSLIFVNNLLYIVAIIYLIVLLAQAGTPGDNRFGSAPDAG